MGFNNLSDFKSFIFRRPNLLYVQLIYRRILGKRRNLHLQIHTQHNILTNVVRSIVIVKGEESELVKNEK